MLWAVSTGFGLPAPPAHRCGCGHGTPPRGWSALTRWRTEYATPERIFLRRWVLANAGGLAIASAVNGALVNAVETRFDGVTSAAAGALVLASTEAVGFGLVGAAMGVAQSISLRRTKASSGWWVVATLAGWVAGGIVSGTLTGAFGGALTGVGPDVGYIGVAVAFAGGLAFLLPGVSQWLVLRGRVARPGIWVAAHALSFLAASLFGFPIMVVVGTAMGWEFPSAAAWGLEGLLAGIVYGVMTGVTLIRMLRQPMATTHEARTS